MTTQVSGGTPIGKSALDFSRFFHMNKCCERAAIGTRTMASFVIDNVPLHDWSVREIVLMHARSTASFLRNQIHKKACFLCTESQIRSGLWQQKSSQRHRFRKRNTSQRIKTKEPDELIGSTGTSGHSVSLGMELLVSECHCWRRLPLFSMQHVRPSCLADGPLAAVFAEASCHSGFFLCVHQVSCRISRVI